MLLPGLLFERGKPAVGRVADEVPRESGLDHLLTEIAPSDDDAGHRPAVAIAIPDKSRRWLGERQDAQVLPRLLAERLASLGRIDAVEDRRTMTPSPYLSASADISPDRLYRYALSRQLAHGDRAVLFVGLNPSTADATTDDPTIRRCVGFARSWGFDWPLPTVPRRRGRPPRVPLSELLPALTYHVIQGTGTLVDHFNQLFGTSLADSSWSDRRRRLPWEIFAELMRRVLRPRATPAQPDAFWRGWRLLALDGTQFSLTNTAQVRATRPKARSRWGRAAFAKMTTAVLLELGLHNLVAAAIGRDGESEWALALQTLAGLPAQALLLADRLYGCAAFAAQAQAACQRVGSHFLFRARMLITPQILRRLRDGSRLIRGPVRNPTHPSRIVEWLEIREIRLRVGRPGHRAQVLRLWTSVLDPRTAPALDLAQLYARRWEHELYFREVKRHLRKMPVLQSHTVETGAHLSALRVSFPKLLQVVQAMWLTVSLGDGVLSERQIQTMLKRGYARLRQCGTPARRSRSCPRKVRQPIKRWPRLMRNESVEGPFHLEIP